MEIVRGGPKLYTRHTHTEAYFISLVFLQKCRNKTKNDLELKTESNNVTFFYQNMQSMQGRLASDIREKPVM